VISNFIKQHITDSNKNAKDVLAKAKDLQKNGLYKYTLQYITITSICIVCLLMSKHVQLFKLKEVIFCSCFQLGAESSLLDRIVHR
jgi:hypothetical protein